MSKIFLPLHSLFRWTGPRESLRTQLIAWNILTLALLLGLLGLVTRYTVRTFLTASVDRELENQARRIPPMGPPHGRGLMGDYSLTFFPTQIGQPYPKDAWLFQNEDKRDKHRMIRRSDDNPYHPRHFDLQGRSLFPFDNNEIPWDTPSLRLAAQGKAHYSQVVVDEVPLRVLSLPINRRGTVIAVGQAAYPLTEVNRAMEGLDTALLTMIPVGLLFAGMGGAYLTDRVLRRVRHTRQAAERINISGGCEDLSARLPVIGNDEFSELAETFNGLLGRLENAFHQQERLLEQQRRFTADASHELKTPLTVIKGMSSMALGNHPSETMYRRSLQEIDRASDTMSHLVQDLLLLARSDGGQLGINRIELLLREVLEQALSCVPHQGRSITLEIADETLCVMGNEVELVRLFSNLLDNAVRYTSKSGSIHITADRIGTNACICVTDTGIGIAPEHLPHLGERFYRVDAARARPDGGTGLGLSICKSIVQAHGGCMRIESTPKVGTTVQLFLPLS